MTLAQIEARAYARLGYDAANPGAAVIARVRGFINETYHSLISKKGFGVLRRQLVTFSSVVGQPMTPLPVMVTQVYSVADRTKGWLLDEVTTTDIRRRDPGLLATGGQPDSWAVYNLTAGGYRPVTPPGAQLFAVSTSASDGASKSLFIQGIDFSGQLRSASVALNGLTEVAFPATIAWSLITKCWIEVPATQGLSAIAVAAGQVVLYETALLGVSIIPQGRSAAKYSMLHLYPTPSSVVLYTADCDLLVEDLIEEGDEPILPQDFHWLLTSGAVVEEYGRREKPVQLSQEMARFKAGMDDLTVFVNRLPAPRHPDAIRRRSQLGSYFRPGT
jgi:hypothetical protein